MKYFRRKSLKHKLPGTALVVFFFILLSYGNVFSQQKDETQGGDDATQTKIENIASTTDQELDFTTLLDNLTEYKEHPLDLNTADKEALRDLTLLSDLQIQALLVHITETGKLLSIEELQSIDGFDLETIYRILPYVRVKDGDGYTEVTFARIFQEGQHTLFIRDQQVLEKSAGYTDVTDSSKKANKSYLGNGQKIYARYRFTFTNKIRFGFTAEKDAGEEFFTGTQKQGFDYYSAHFFYKGNGFLKEVALGDFQVQYGQGLVLWSGLGFGKSADVMNIKKNARGILPYSSVDENLFMRGGAVSVGGKKVLLDLFYSQHKIDANVTDTNVYSNEELVSSFTETGYHRTYAELADKHTTDVGIYGGHLHFRTGRISIGATAYATEYGSTLVKDVSPYNQFDFSGKKNFNAGIDYSYIYRNFNFFGEAGRSENGGMAFLNGVLISLDPRLALSVLHRHYEKNYQAILSNALSENTRNANEDGLYFGVITKPGKGFTLSAYYDQFKFPWLRYLTDAPSYGKEYLAQLTYTPNKVFESYFRVRQQSKPANISGDIHAISNLNDIVQTNYRYNIHYKISSSFTLANRIEYVTYRKGEGAVEKGFVIYQDINYKPLKSKMRFNARYVLFDTDTYNTRIYAYENDVLYAYSIPSYYYRGSRFYITVQYKIIRGIDVWLRYATTVYDNQQTVGTSLDEINGHTKSEIKGQVRFTF